MLERLALIIAVYILVNIVTVRFVVEGASMHPTLTTGQFLVVNRLQYTVDDPQRGDIVVFHAPANPQQDFIKRIIALPGETIEFRASAVYIDGQLLNEPYINEACIIQRCPDSILLLGYDEYFVMGDNRNRSSDSRQFGAIERNRIVGAATLRYWPPTQLGWIHRIGFPDG